MTSTDGEVLQLVVPLSRRLKTVALGAFLTGGALWAALSGLYVAWVLVVVVGLLEIVSVIELARGTRLEIGPTSFAKVDAFNRRTVYDFGKCGPFAVYRQPMPFGRSGSAQVAFNYEDNTGQVAGLNRRFAGWNTYLNAAFGIPASDLVTLLNDHRASASDAPLP